MRHLASVAAVTTLAILPNLACAPIEQSIGSGSKGGTSADSARGGANGLGGTTTTFEPGTGGLSGLGGVTTTTNILQGGTTGSPSAGGSSALGGSSSTAPSGDDCPIARSFNPPGTQLTSPYDWANANCFTLSAAIADVHRQWPELADISTISSGTGTDGNLVFAYRGLVGFNLVFKRGWGDCEAGCINNEYWYFETDASCQPRQVGHYRAEYVNGSNCYAVAGTPLWGKPLPRDPKIICGGSAPVQNISGLYHLRALGESMPCTMAGETKNPTRWGGLPTLLVTQDASLTTGTVKISGTGRAQLDDVPLTATFEARKVTVSQTISGANPSCFAERTIQLTFDLDLLTASSVSLDEIDTPDCSKPNDYCKGYLHMDLCPSETAPATTPLPACTVGMHQSCNEDPSMSSLLGLCDKDGYCACTREGYAPSPLTGKCTLWAGGRNAVCAPEVPGKAPSCNGTPIASWPQGFCLSDGSCHCYSNSVKDPATGLCVTKG